MDGEAAWDDAVSTVLQTLADGSDSVFYLPEDHPNSQKRETMNPRACLPQLHWNTVTFRYARAAFALMISASSGFVYLEMSWTALTILPATVFGKRYDNNSAGTGSQRSAKQGDAHSVA